MYNTEYTSLMHLRETLTDMQERRSDILREIYDKIKDSSEASDSDISQAISMGRYRDPIDMYNGTEEDRSLLIATLSNYCNKLKFNWEFMLPDFLASKEKFIPGDALKYKYVVPSKEAESDIYVKVGELLMSDECYMFGGAMLDEAKDMWSQKHHETTLHLLSMAAQIVSIRPLILGVLDRLAYLPFACLAAYDDELHSRTLAFMATIGTEDLAKRLCKRVGLGSHAITYPVSLPIILKVDSKTVYWKNIITDEVVELSSLNYPEAVIWAVDAKGEEAEWIFTAMHDTAHGNYSNLVSLIEATVPFISDDALLREFGVSDKSILNGKKTVSDKVYALWHANIASKRSMIKESSIESTLLGLSRKM